MSVLEFIEQALYFSSLDFQCCDTVSREGHTACQTNFI